MTERAGVLDGVSRDYSNFGRACVAILLTAGLTSVGCGRPEKIITCQVVDSSKEWHPLPEGADHAAYAKVLGIDPSQVEKGKRHEEVMCSEPIEPDGTIVKVTMESVPPGLTDTCGAIAIRSFQMDPETGEMYEAPPRVSTVCPVLPASPAPPRQS